MSRRRLRVVPAPRALLLENIHSHASDLLAAAGYEIEALPRALGEQELIERLADVDVLGIRSATQLTERVLAGARQLQAIGAFCIGTNQIALDAASECGVAVFNAPYSNTRSVVELVVCEMIALSRGLTAKNAQLHEGVWDKSAAGSHEIRGRTLGIIGYGNIGAQLSVLGEALGMRVIFYDRADRLRLGNAVSCQTMDELLAQADVVSIHVDGRDGNRDFFGETQFEQMKLGALFLNLSRGFVTDLSALRAHLESGHLAGAALDVFPNEPRSKADPFISELQGLPNVILTPHVGGSTEEAQEDIGRFVAEKLISYLDSGSTALSVNLPNLTLPRQSEAHRLIHIHRNEPGVLAQINRILAEHGANIVGQYLATRGPVGYVTTDINRAYDSALLERIQGLPQTLRFWVRY
jgi:D-3-phosphoglycerate dehydrogenase / 2-oxoglutarate reductase